ncbi:hypothetical protein ES703_45160 [subsurface metagenome]
MAETTKLTWDQLKAKIKKTLRQLCGKDLPKSVTKQPEPRYLFRDEPPDINIEKAIIQRAREEWLPQPTTKRKTRDKSHRPPAAEHDIGELMKHKGSKRQLKQYITSTKAHLGPEEED